MWLMYWISCHTLVVCRPRESCQHQTRAGFHWGGDKGLLEGLGGLPRVRGGSQQSHIYLLSIAFVNMDPPVHLTSPLSSLSWRVYALRTIFLPWAEGRLQFQSLVWCRLQKSVWIWSTSESSVKIHTNCCKGRLHFIPIWGLRERATCLPGWCGDVVFTTYNKRILRLCLTFSGIDHKLRSTV